jgi:hypothetical protein
MDIFDLKKNLEIFHEHVSLLNHMGVSLDHHDYYFVNAIPLVHKKLVSYTFFEV